MKKYILSAVLMMAISSQTAMASEGAALPKQDWSFSGVFGTFDRAALRRGLQVYREVCASCHGLDLVSYRHLRQVDFSEDEIKEIAAAYEVTDGPNEEGDMFTRPALPSDRFANPFANANAARASNNGAFPPDLSLMVKARKGHADYLYAVLTGYKEEAPEGVQLMEGMNFNQYFPGNQIAMPPPLSEDGVEYADGTKATVAQMAKDVTVFLAWAASPELEERKRLGIKVLFFLIVLTGMVYAIKRKIWADLH
ncbi:MAG: cytochrome c1 [Rhodospirillales bacterium]|nr:cytochrome c1 [Rhodospirillales bacterium]